MKNLDKCHYCERDIVDKFDSTRYGSKGGAYLDLTEKNAVKQFLDKEEVSTVLDVGCGTGRLSVFLAEMGYNVTAFDNSKRMLENVAKKAEKIGLDIKFVRGDAVSLPFKKGEFDCVMSFHALPYNQEYPQIIMSMSNVTREGGILIIDALHSHLYKFLLDVNTRIMRQNKPYCWFISKN